MTDMREPAGPDSFMVARSDHACFGCGDENPIGLRLRFRPEGDGVKTTFVPAPEHQGFEDVVHGGIISAVLDEAMAWATAHAGVWAVTGEMRVRFRHPLKIGEPTNVVAHVTGARGRIVTAAAEMRLNRDGSSIATSSGTFVRVEADFEAAWRARYLQDAELGRANSGGMSQDATAASAERIRAGPPGSAHVSELDT